MFFRAKKKPVEAQEIRLEKWNALGNDFLISKTQISPEQIKKLSDRNFGIGCDQFIILNEKSLQFFNSDGTESGMCGNALKCVAEIVSRETQETSFELTLKHATTKVKKEEDGMFSVCIGKAIKFKEEGNPFLYLTFDETKKRRDTTYDFFKLLQNKENSFYFVDLGNPHLVCILNISEEDPLVQLKIFDTFLSSKNVGEVIDYLGDTIQRDFLKTSGVNVSFVVIESEKEVYVRTFERGVGQTLSCGSAACASVFSGIKAGLVSREAVKVFNKGSEKVEEIEESFHVISLDNEENIWLKGKGRKVGTIILNN